MSTSSRGMYCTSGLPGAPMTSARVESAMTAPPRRTMTRFGSGTSVMSGLTLGVLDMTRLLSLADEQVDQLGRLAQHRVVPGIQLRVTGLETLRGAALMRLGRILGPTAADHHGRPGALPELGSVANFRPLPVAVAPSLPPITVT